jgi:hypothetical protein
MITFHLFYAGVDGIKVVLNSRQQYAICVCWDHYPTCDHLPGTHQVWFVLEANWSSKLFL